MNILKDRPALISLFVIFAISIFLRFHSLADTPSGFHQDEVANVYVGRFIFEHGVDLYGNKWPLLYFDKHGDYPPVLPMYISALGTYLFGFTQYAARFFPALMGAVIVFPLFFITKIIFKNRTLSLLAAFMGAVIPWQMSFSRIGAEGIMATTVFMIGLWFFISSYNHKSIPLFVSSIFLLFSTYLLYPSFRITVPLVFLAAILIYEKMPLPVSRKEMDPKKTKIISRILFVATILAFVSTIYISTTPWGRGRYDQTSLVSKYTGLSNPANQFIYNENNLLVARIFNNKYVYVAKDFIIGYMDYFSPQFLFDRAGEPEWFDIPNSGLFFFTQAILLLALFLPFLYKKNFADDKRGFIFLIAILFISPLAAALTAEFIPNSHRSILLSVMLIFPLVHGFNLLQNLSMRKLLNVVIAVLFVGEFIFFYHNYFQHVSMFSAILRGDGNRQMVEYLQKERGKYDKVYMLATGWFPIYYLYFTHNFDTGLIGKFHNMRTDKVDNVYFIEQDCPEAKFYEGDNPEVRINPNEKVLVIVNSSCLFNFSYMFDKVDSIVAANRLAVYDIWRFNSVFYKTQKRPGINFQ